MCSFNVPHFKIQLIAIDMCQVSVDAVEVTVEELFSRHCLKMKFSITDFFSKCDEICTEEILNRKLRFLAQFFFKILSVFCCAKSVRIWSCSGPHFPAFGLNTETYEISLRTQSELGKMRTRITLSTDTFHEVLTIGKD